MIKKTINLFEQFDLSAEDEDLLDEIWDKKGTKKPQPQKGQKLQEVNSYLQDAGIVIPDEE